MPTGRRYSQSTLYSLANIDDLFVQAVVCPTARLSGRADLHRVSLASSADGWYAGSGATQNRGRIFGFTLRPSGGETGLMTVVEGSLDFRVTPKSPVNGYVGSASAGPPGGARELPGWPRALLLRRDRDHGILSGLRLAVCGSRLAAGCGLRLEA